jgi:hypothetical protein
MGCNIYMAGITSVEPAAIKVGVPAVPNQPFKVKCASAGGCKVGAKMFLCDARTPGKQLRKKSAQARLQRTADRLEAKFSPIELTIGLYYQICMDLEAEQTDALLDTGVVLFASGNFVVDPLVAPRTSGITFILQCDACTGSTEVFLGDDCEPDTKSPAPYQTSVTLNYIPAPSAPMRSNPGVLVFNTTSTTNGVVIWLVTLDLTPLQAGRRAKVCVDYDGSSGSQLSGDTGESIYIAGVTAINRTSVRRGSQQVIPLTCKDGCINGVSQAFLAINCAEEKQVGVGSLSPSSAPQETSTARGLIVFNAVTGYEVTLDTRGLPLGTDVRLCTDLDGAMPTLTAADAGHHLHVAAASLGTTVGSSQGQASVLQASETVVQLSCVEGCNVESAAMLVPNASTCAASAVAMSKLLPDGDLAFAGAYGGYGANMWKALFDTSTLSVGYYRLCIDLDGQGSIFVPGDSGELVNVQAS